MEYSSECCRLCLSFIADKDFHLVEDIKKNIDILPLKLDSGDADKHIICNICSVKLLAVVEFKFRCLSTDAVIIPYVDLEKPIPVDLKEIYMKEKRCTILDEQKICRLCMRLVTDEFTSVSELEIDIFQKYVPEMDFRITEDPVICKLCSDALNNHNSFMKNCLELEERMENSFEVKIINNHSFIQSNVCTQSERIGDDEKEVAKVESETNFMEAEENWEEGKVIKMEAVEIKNEYTEEQSLPSTSMELHKTPTVTRKRYKAKRKGPLAGKGNSDNAESSLNASENKEHKCEICDYRSELKLDFKNHSLTHKEILRYQCDVCDYKSKYKSHLQQHMSTHKASSEFQKNLEFKLGESKFQKLSYQEQLSVKERGRPMPDLNIEVAAKSRGRTYKRQFNKDIYLRNNWICGCSVKNAFFCFPCVLFGIGHDEKIWRETGVTDLVHLSERIKKHENGKTHIGNQMRFALFGNVNIQAQFDSAYWINIQKHNEEVTKNRYVLSKIIDCIKFCGAFELALRGHDDTEKSENPGIFRGLVNFTSELDNTLSEHLKNATIFKGASKKIQNEILDCILEVCHEEICNEINEAPYLAVMADEITDVSAKFQMVIVLRYVTKQGTPVERFWTFVLPEKHDADSLAVAILHVIDPILKNNKNKLIAQSYDGAAVMSGERGGVQALIQQNYEHAHFVHCYAHQLNQVMARACSINSQVRVFFGDLHDIPRFFTHSPQRIAVLDKIVGRHMPPTHWNFNISTVNVVYEHRDPLIGCMEQLEEDSNAVTCKEARGIRRILEDPNFTFWLTFFHYIMPHVDVLHNHLQKTNMEPIEVQRVVTVFEQSIDNVRNKVDCIIEKASNINTSPSEVKRKRLNDSKQDRRVACIEVCEVIINVARERFAFSNHLVASSLLYSDNFEKFNNKFPENELNSTCTAYNFLNKQRLLIELSVLYSNLECRTLHGAVPFLKFIISNNLDETMTETKKLLQILLTTPMTTPEAERSFSTLKRIKTFLRNSVCEEGLTALSMISIEKKYISSIPNFNEKVIEKFATKKDRHIELQLKKIQ